MYFKNLNRENVKIRRVVKITEYRDYITVLRCLSSLIKYSIISVNIHKFSEYDSIITNAF